MPGPLLSVGIPTYNRARLLESALRSLVSQVREAGEKVELIVSDNCSTDDTADVVRKARELVPIRYRRNDRNLGLARNVLGIANELATGEFVWMIGDDELVMPGAVRRILGVLEKHSEVDYVFVNTCSGLHHQRKGFEESLFAGKLSISQIPPKGRDTGERVVDRWERLIDPDVDNVFLGALMCSVFRLSRWKQFEIDPKRLPGDKGFCTLEEAYPHSVMLARTMVGRPAYYLGTPCTANFFGQQEWMGALPLLVLVRLQELLDLYREVGVEPASVEKCRERLLVASYGPLLAMLSNRKTPGRRQFSLCRFAWQNRRHAKRLLRIGLLTVLPEPVRAALRSAKRRVVSLR
jgi:hypothetical protein